MRWLKRHAWWLFLASAAISVVFGLSDLTGVPDNTLAVTGKSTADLQTSSPEAYSLVEECVRIGGVHLMALGLLAAAIVLFGFRRDAPLGMVDDVAPSGDGGRSGGDPPDDRRTRSNSRGPGLLGLVRGSARHTCPAG